MAELRDVLDFILNHCTIREIDAVAEAVERRRKLLYSRQGVSTLDPAQYAKKTGEAIRTSIQHTISGMSESFRDFAWNLIKQESPELSDEETEHIVKALIPDISVEKPAEKNTAIPNKAIAEMVQQFVLYSQGMLDEQAETALRSSMGEWPSAYWNVFPQAIRALIKSYLQQEIDDITFQASLAVLLS